MIENILTKPSIRILREMLAVPNREFNVNELSELTGFSGGHFVNTLNNLVIYGLIKKTRINRYKIIISPLIESFNIIFKYEYEKLQQIHSNEKNIISDFLTIILRKFSDINEIILFGSVARGFYSNSSDIDILIIKNNIDNKVELEISKITSRFKRNIQVFLHTEKEFSTSNDELFNQIKREGISLTKLFSELDKF